MGEDEIVTLGGVGPERLVLFRRRPGLDVADGETEGVVDALESGVSARVPGGVGDAAWRDEADANSRGPGLRGASDRDSSATS